jgi:DNA polymerase-3 subunit delta'
VVSLSDAARRGKDSASGIAENIRPGALFHKLITEFATGGAVHAYLFTGPGGVGKRTLAMQCAMALLCAGESKPCFACPPCIRFLNGTHPDAKIISGEKSIGVDVIREAVRLTGEHSYEGGHRVILIVRAEKMTAQAQNCLLKTLEEPPGDSVFLLTAEEASSLLPTVVSRCRVIPIPPWTQEEMEPVLQNSGAPKERIEELCLFSGGSIGTALALYNDPMYGELRRKLMQTVFSMESAKDIFPIGNAMREEKEQADGYLDMMESLVREVLLTRLNQRDIKTLEDFPKRWCMAGEKAPIPSLQRVMDAIFLARRRKSSQVSWQAVLEELLLKITEEVISWQL